MSRLLENQKEYRDTMLAKNIFTNEDNYNIGNSRALSDGDEHGKGQTSTVGSATDILKRNQLQAKNLFNKNNPYDASKA